MTDRFKNAVRRKRAVHVGPPPIMDSSFLSASSQWKLNLGAVVSKKGTHFRVWAPKHTSVVVDITKPVPQQLQLTPEQDGYFSGFFEGIKEGARYRYRLGSASYPDPCSRYQPEGPHGDSMIIDPDSYQWKDGEWKGLDPRGQIIYEMHIGAFTEEGTFDAAIAQFKELKNTGVTTIEVMPVNECAGRWNWGYDGVSLFAPYHVYGGVNAFKRFVDAAHQEGLAVILDVVYNHLGPDGNYTGVYSDDYFTDLHKTDWGKAINFDGPQCEPVRDFFINNACYWISEYHLDGLRLDATQNIYDASTPHILSEISEKTRAVAGERKILLIAENEPQDVRCISPVENGGFGLDGVWNDDFHHAARVALTGFREAYFTDYKGTPQEFISLMKQGYLFQGQYYEWQEQQRGTLVTFQPAQAFLLYTQNHDQIANHLQGQRLHELTDRQKYRALMALTLLSPGTPMLFMGQEFEATSNFVFFTDHNADLANAVNEGRKEFLSQFPTYRDKDQIKKVPMPNLESTFRSCKLNFDEREKNREAHAFIKDLLLLRKTDPVISRQNRKSLDGAILGPHTFLIRTFGMENGDRLLVINLGEEMTFSPCPEPYLVPPQKSEWKLTWASTDKRYGGDGKINWTPDRWQIPASSALFFRSEKLTG